MGLKFIEYLDAHFQNQLSGTQALQFNRTEIFQSTDGIPPSCRSDPASRLHPIRALVMMTPLTGSFNISVNTFFK